MSIRQERVRELMRDYAAEYLQKHVTRHGLITVTGIDLSPDFKNITILISVLPDTQAEEALDASRRELHGLREFVKSQVKMRVLPFFEIEIDEGEKKRQKFDEVLRRVKKEEQK